MAKFADVLSGALIRFVEKQLVFFVATAGSEGRINLSPKGMDTFRVCKSDLVRWVDLGGSGNETAAHLLENGRITLMFCSFGRKPLILRLYGEGRTIQRRQDEWQAMASSFSDFPAARQIFEMKIASVQTSCGYGVPVATDLQERSKPKEWAADMSWPEHEERLRRHDQHKSIDGFPTGLFED